MAQPKVVILGCTGMLGAMTLDYLNSAGDFELIATHRNQDEKKSLQKKYPNVHFRDLNAEKANVNDIAAVIEDADWAINAIGVIKPYIHDDNAAEVERATKINSLFPHLLAKAAKQVNAKVIQIATDCVYSGEKGQYIETDAHDALDVYGKTKSLGEAYFGNIYHVRCSIIGPELKAHLSLLDWFLGQPEKAELNGFTNHQWNGVTTLHFARICKGIISEELLFQHVQHIIPGNMISKASLLRSFAKQFRRDDIKVNDVEAPKVIDRTLLTNNEELNQRIWKAAGYNEPPTIEHMVEELSEYGFTNGDKN
jgi:dTDP-4-dehydrorhamnose reductase